MYEKPDNYNEAAMAATIADYRGTPEEDEEITSLLHRVYVEAGFTDRSAAQQTLSAAEVQRRGAIMLARSPDGHLVGMIICASADNPYRQVATSDEAEMQLLAVDPDFRGAKLGVRLCLAFERKAAALGYSKLVLSTQPAMQAAQNLYQRLGYRRNAARDWVRSDRSFLVFEKSL